ncbi:ATP-binding protein [Geminisphaera colitermitum]|uniref:ATP-binding protein n=1 Tax=Geminisphaera colitermitum TaxID=1148786 RepID=UPI000158CCC6|nr:ATP-binding protein [Geminisphaera colitermitum]
MPSFASAQIDFQKIRSIRGTQHGGFEELCVTLFRAELNNPPNLVRIDGAGGDGGVEAYVQTNPRTTVGLQTKYFAQLRDPQWRQIEKSFRSARKNHPTLTRYFVAVPLDLNPHTAKKWKGMQAKARALHPPLQMQWWGASELTHRLTTTVHAGRAAYWFGTPQFDLAWLAARNQEARDALDTRYTPEQHIRVKAQDTLSAFAREPHFVSRYFAEASKVWKAMRRATEYPPPKEVTNILGGPFGAVVAATVEELPRLGDGITVPELATAHDATQKMLASLTAFSTAVSEAQDAAKALPKPTPSPTGAHQSSVADRLGYRDHEVRTASDTLYNFSHFLREQIAADRRRLLVSGEAGAGKSHLLARVVEECLGRSQAALFLLGEFFTTSADPWTQLVARLGWNGSTDDLLAALNHTGEVRGLPSLIVVDAINETTDRTVWARHLGAFSKRIDQWPWIRLVISCRSDFIPICIPQNMVSQGQSYWATTQHRGFGETTFEATARYFTAYNVQARDLPPLLPEFQNPLFLKTFCEAFENAQIPSGPLSFDLVMRKRIDRTTALLVQSIECPSDVTQSAIDLLATLLANADGQPIPIAEARSKIDALFPGKILSRSLFHHLCSSGLVTEVGHYDHNTKITDVRVRFAYERFSDYFIAQRLLTGAKTFSQLRKDWQKGGLIEWWKTYRGYYTHRGLLTALAVLLPEKFKVEMAEVIAGRDVQQPVLEDFLASLPWRNPASITPKTHALLARARQHLSADRVLEVLFRIAAVVDHPFNAFYLDRWLREMPLWQREEEWTIATSQQLIERGESSLPATIVRWLFGVDTTRVPSDQAQLVAIVLCWLCSSNDRGFRRRATLAGIHVVAGRCELAADLVNRFHSVNDPYVVERMFAIAAGAAVREKEATKLAPLALAVWKHVFARAQVPPHVLMRDFAFTIMECARNLGCLPKGVTPKDYRPPYRSRWPKIWPEKKARAFGKPDGWRTIVHSIEPEYGNGIGGYGDFGRYTMEAHMKSWINVRRNKPIPAKDKRRAFDGLVARAWTLQRVAELGWTPKRFKEYEDNLRDYGRSANDDTKQERISKKYQWIALHELEGYASDHFHFGYWYNDSPEKFEGAWQLFSKNFDPAQPLRDPLAKDAENLDDDNLWWRNCPDPFADRALLKDQSTWVETLPQGVEQMLRLDSVPSLSGPAFLLNAWFDWDEPDSYPPRTRDDGKCHQWIHVRSWVVPTSEVKERLRFLEKNHFYGTGVGLPKFGSEGLGEYPWSSRFDSLRKTCANEGRFGVEFPPGFTHTVADYSEDETSASVPSPQLAKLLDVKWTGKDFIFADGSGTTVAFAPRRPPKAGATSCLVDAGRMIETLNKNGLTLIWAVLGERNCFDEMANGSVADKLMSFSGVYRLQADGKIVGGLTIHDVTLLGKEPSGRYAGATKETFVHIPTGKVLARYDSPTRRGQLEPPKSKEKRPRKVAKLQKKRPATRQKQSGPRPPAKRI